MIIDECITTLLDLTNNLIGNIDNRLLNAVALNDLRKAFDLINHNIFSECMVVSCMVLTETPVVRRWRVIYLE